MKALNKQALRQLAEKATPGPWEMEHENIWFKDAEGYTKHLMYAYQGDDVDDQQDHDNTAYIAAFNPKVVLALLDELEAAEKRIAEQREYYEGVIADGSRRIAELEARTVTLPDAMMPARHNSGELFMSPDNVDYGGYLNRDDVVRNLRAAGIGVKGE